MKKLMTLMLSASLLTACGWQLRGSVNLPDGMNSIYIASQSQNSVAAAELTKVLSASGIELASSAKTAPYSLKLSNEREERRSISVNSSGLTSEYELVYEVDYVITDGQGKILAPQTTASVVRSYTYDRDDVIAKDQEEAIIRKEMKAQLASQILSRLRFLSKPATAPQETDGQAAP